MITLLSVLHAFSGGTRINLINLWIHCSLLKGGREGTLFRVPSWSHLLLYTAPIYSPALPFRIKDGGSLHKRISSFYSVPALWANSWARQREDEGCMERTPKLRTPSWPHAAVVNTNRVVVFPLQPAQPSYTTCVPSYNTCVYYY